PSVPRQGKSRWRVGDDTGAADLKCRYGGAQLADQRAMFGTTSSPLLLRVRVHAELLLRGGRRWVDGLGGDAASEVPLGAGSYGEFVHWRFFIERARARERPCP